MDEARIIQITIKALRRQIDEVIESQSEFYLFLELSDRLDDLLVHADALKQSRYQVPTHY